jgi:signal transduction histidine kinase
MGPGGRLRHWLRRHRQRVTLALIAVALLVAVAAATVGGFRLHHAVLLERQTLRTQKLLAASLELHMPVPDGSDPRTAADAAFRSVAAHDAGEARRLHPAYVAFVHAPRSPATFETLEQAIQAELARQESLMRTVNPSARSALILAAVAAGLLALLLAWQFELARRAGRIDRDHAARARELIHLRDEFVAVVSHELRTPMTSIIGYLELIAEGEAGPLTAEQRSYLGIVSRSTDRLVELVDELLLVAEAGRGRLTLERTTLSAGALVSDAVLAARPAADTKEIVLRAESSDGPDFRGDAKRLGQMLDNLVSNAIKFTPAGGRVVVRSERSAGTVLFEVSDTGEGVPLDERERLFDAFFRARAATANAIPGTGLGLTITKAIVDAHGGTIELATEPGRGSTFRVRIPAGTP